MTFHEYINFLFGNCKKYEATLRDLSINHKKVALKANKIRIRRHNDWLIKQNYIMEAAILEVKFRYLRETLMWTVEKARRAAVVHYDRRYKRAKTECAEERDFHYICICLSREQDSFDKRWREWDKKSKKFMADYYREL